MSIITKLTDQYTGKSYLIDCVPKILAVRMANLESSLISLFPEETGIINQASKMQVAKLSADLVRIKHRLNFIYEEIEEVLPIALEKISNEVIATTKPAELEFYTLEPIETDLKNKNKKVQRK